MTSTNNAHAPAWRAVLVTGASTGIGEACALHMDRKGWRVYAGVRRQADADALRAKASPRLIPVTIDVTDEASIANAAVSVERDLAERGLAGLVNNAGIAIAGPLEFTPIEDLRRQIEVNVIGQVAVTQAFMPLIRRARGRIVNMGSIGGRLASPFFGPYNASKFALEAITDSLRQELRPWGIHVSVIEPGSIATPIWDKGIADAEERERRLPQAARDLYQPYIDAMKAKAIELGGRGIPPEQVAKAVDHALTSPRPKTRYVVGRDARLQALAANIVPDRLMDRLVASQMGLPAEPPANPAPHTTPTPNT